MLTEKQKTSAIICQVCGAGILLILVCAIIVCAFSPPPPKAGSVPPPDTHKTLPATFEDLLNAIEWVESRGDANAMGDWTEWAKVKYIDYLQMETIAEYELRWNRQYDYSEWYAREAHAIGAYQIHKIYVDNVNRILKLQGSNKRYTYEDRWNRDKSRAMVSIYTTYWGWRISKSIRPQGIEEMARIHNGGPQGWKKESTKAYWLKVKARLETGE